MSVQPVKSPDSKLPLVRRLVAKAVGAPTSRTATRAATTSRAFCRMLPPGYNLRNDRLHHYCWQFDFHSLRNRFMGLAGAVKLKLQTLALFWETAYCLHLIAASSDRAAWI